MIGTIIYNEDKEKAVKLHQRLLEYFKIKGILIVPKSESEKADFAVVLGGDGTLLRASKVLIKNTNIDIFAINVGTLGFLTEIKREEFFKTFEDYLKGKYIKETRKFLKVVINNEEYDVLNEVVIFKSCVSSKMINIVVNGKGGGICNYKADGIVISTPTGSTAYSLSAGGPIIMPTIKAMVITPLAPHNLTSRAIVIDAEEILSLSLTNSDKACIMVDGDKEKVINSDDKIEIFYSGKSINLILPEDRDYYSILREKLKWGDNLC